MPPAQLDAGRQDLLAGLDLVGRVDVLHDQGAAELADDVAAWPRSSRSGR